MKKIVNIKLNDFRAFKNEAVFDFRDKAGEAANFVCIYGQNGMGKSSFFDGVEWVYSGKIDRMESDIIDRIKKYKGLILKNTNSKNKEVSVQVDYDNGEMIKRVFRKTNHNNDYHEGVVQEGSRIDIGMIQQILPHNKIDNFIYARSPEDKFNEWGKFWDENGSERKYFSQIYSLIKVNENKRKELNIKEKELEHKIKELCIDSKLIKKLNEQIESYNEITKDAYKFLTIRQIDGVWNFPQIDKLNQIKNELQLQKEKLESQNAKINFIKSNYKSVIDNNMKIQQLKKTINRWEKIINFAHVKKENLELKETYIDKKNIYEQNLYKINTIYLKTESWFNSYILIKNLNFQIKLSKEQEKIINDNYDEEKKILKKLDEELKYLKIKLDYIKENKDKLSLLSKQYNKCSDNIMINENAIDYNCELIKKNHNRISDMDNIINEIKVFENIDECKLIEKLKTFFVNDKSIMDIIGDLKNNLNEIIQTINTKEQFFNYLENNYKEIKQNASVYEESIIRIKSYIEIENLNICPICKQMYGDKDELISRINIDLSKQQLENILIEKEKAENLIKKSIKEKNELLEKWDEDYQSMKDKLLKIIYDIQEENARALDCIKNIKEEIEIDKNVQKNIYVTLSENNILNEEIEITNFDTILSKKIDFYKSEIEKNSIQYDEKYEKCDMIFSCLNKQRQNVEKVINEYNDFYNDIENKKLIEWIENFRNIDRWIDIVDMHKNLIIKKDEVCKCIDNCNIIIDKYSYIDIKKLDYYYNKVISLKDILRECEDLSINKKYKDYVQEVFQNKKIGISDIKSRIKSIERNLINLNKKRIIIDVFLENELSIIKYQEEYVFLKEELDLIIKQKIIYSELGDRLNNIFILSKKNLENNIKEILTNDTVSQIYKKIDPHKTFDSLVYDIGFNNNNRPELHIKVFDSINKIDTLPELFYSSAQLNTIALSLFLGEALSRHSEVKSIFIDDPVGHFDDINVLAFCDLIRTIISQNKWQIIMSTHDESLFNLLRNKISDEYYSAKFIKFESVGVIKYI